MKTTKKITLPETNIAPENRPSQKETSIPTIHFQVRIVSFREDKRLRLFRAAHKIHGKNGLFTDPWLGDLCVVFMDR